MLLPRVVSVEITSAGGLSMDVGEQALEGVLTMKLKHGP